MQGAFNVDWDHVLDNEELDEETTRLYRQKTDEVEVARRTGPVAGRGRGRGRGKRAGDRDRERRRRLGVVQGARMDMPKGKYARDDDEEEDEDVEEEEELEEEDEDEDEESDDEDGPEDAEGPDGGGEPDDRPVVPAAPAAPRPRRPRPASPHPPAQRFTSEGEQFFVVPGDAHPRPGIFGHYLKPYTVDEDEECVPFPPPEDYDANADKRWDGEFLSSGWPGLPWPSKALVQAVFPLWKRNLANWIPNSITDDVAGWSRGLLPAYREAMRANRGETPFEIERKKFHDNRGGLHRATYFHISTPYGRDPSLPPNLDACTPGVHFTECSNPLAEHPAYYEVGSEFLKKKVEEGEALDFAFARRMQGLLGVAQEHVWACLDPSFNPADRPAAMERFTASYTASFYKAVSWQDQQDPRAVATEALQQHKAFCEEWVHKHYRTLTPVVTAAAEALVADFYDSVRDRMHKGAILSVQRFARLMMRHPVLSQYFGVCLQSYMTSIDQSRPGRNASYKAMNTATVMRFQSFKRFVREFESHAHVLHALYKELAELEHFHFHPYVVDWYDIAGQLPEAHRFFARPQDNLLLKRLRNPNGEGRAPWLVGRD
jgi:hypothetical protein